MQGGPEELQDRMPGLLKSAWAGAAGAAFQPHRVAVSTMKPLNDQGAASRDSLSVKRSYLTCWPRNGCRIRWIPDQGERLPARVQGEVVICY